AFPRRPPLLSPLQHRQRQRLQLPPLQHPPPPQHKHHQLRFPPDRPRRQEVGRRREFVPPPRRDRRAHVALPVGLIGDNSRQDSCRGLRKRASAAIRDYGSEIRSRAL